MRARVVRRLLRWLKVGHDVSKGVVRCGATRGEADGWCGVKTRVRGAVIYVCIMEGGGGAVV
jgi:hypothetical protein